MVQKNHTVSIVVEGTTLDLNGQDELNLRINSVLYDPTKISPSTGEYSFSFDLPMTPTNCKVFDYANVASKTNKFNKLWNSEVYTDGHLVFQGQIKIASIEQGQFKVNLVSVKAGSLTDIFGEDTCNNLTWSVDYDGMETVTAVNANADNYDYFFPMVCYGPFLKTPQATFSNEYNSYTSKYAIDKYVQFYDSTFPPSVKLIELIKRFFQRKGYTVSGDIFSDPTVNEIYLSTHLSESQIPLYNLGNPKLGKCTVKWSGFKNMQLYTYGGGWARFGLSGINRALTFPHEYEPNSGGHYQFENVLIYDVWDACSRYNGHWDGSGRPPGLTDMSVEADNPHMWKKNCIVIPATGSYKIEMNVEMSIENAEALSDVIFWKDQYDNTETRTVAKGWAGMPLEIQLLRNEEETELIYGFDGKYVSGYPHEAPGYDAGSTVGTAASGYGSPSSGGSSSGSGNHRTGGGGARGTVGTRGGSDESDLDNVGSRAPGESDQTANFGMGYVPQQGQLVAYDPWVNSNFLCGFTSIGKSPSVIKRGYSWNPESSEYMYSRYYLDGYYGVNHENDYYDWIKTSWNQNTYPGSPTNSMTANGSYKFTGKLSCIVNLKEGDVLFVKAITRAYELSEWNGGIGSIDQRLRFYRVDCNGSMTIEAYSPKWSDIESEDLRYTSPTKFDVKLNLAQFFADNVKQADFVQNFINAFNLDFHVEGNNAIFNRNRINFNELTVPIELDDRVNTDELTIEPIDYPRSMQINYTIKDDEAGFYNSIPKDHINDDDWKDWAEVGSEKVQLNVNEDAEDQSKTLTNSYDWYADFTLEDGRIVTLPLIIKDEWMIENYKVEESMQADGYSLPQRWWFRDSYRTDITFTDVNGNEFHPYFVRNSNGEINLNYTTAGETLLTKYFNITPFVGSDMITAEVYLSAEQYSLLKLGAPVRINSDIYYVCSITGYDPTGNNPAQIKAMKKG